MGPIDIFLGWQPLLVAMVVYMATQLVKSILDVAMGKDKRKANRVISKVLLPALPPILGAVAAFIPAHPASLVEYVADQELDWATAQLIYASWGAACGQFADYFYSKVKDLIAHSTKPESEDG